MDKDRRTQMFKQAQTDNNSNRDTKADTYARDEGKGGKGNEGKGGG